MGADFPTNSNIERDEIRLSELGPNSIFRLKQELSQNPKGFHLNKKQAMTLLKLEPRVVEILYNYFDMDGDGEIDEYELTCALAMIVHSSLDLRAELIFKLYDFNSNNYLSRDELIYLLRSINLANNTPIVNVQLEEKVDSIIKEADLDLDKKLSLREFQLYAYKNREMFACLDKFEKLITRNPIGPPSTMDRPGIKKDNVYDKEESDNTDDDAYNENIDNDEDGDIVNIGDDEDLLAELNKANEVNERFENNENYERIKQGVEYDKKKEVWKEMNLVH